MEKFNIRNEKPTDYKAVEALVRESFWNVYRPGCAEHFVLHKMRSNPDFVPELSFVMEQNGKIIGQNVFVKTHILADNGNKIPIMTMGPICIANNLKRRGYGKALLDYSLERAAEYGAGAVCFEGNIEFYGKSGFSYAANFGIRYHGLPENADSSFFLCKELKPDYLHAITGEYKTPDCYFADDADVEQFDKAFPPKEKSVFTTQIFKTE